MLPDEDQYTLTYNALRHPTRRRIIKLIAKRSRTYTEIMKELGIDKGLLNYHLENLNGLLRKDKEDKYILTNAGWVTIDLDNNFEARVLDERLKLLGFRLDPTILKVALIILTILSASLFLNYINTRSEMLVLRDRFDELSYSVAGLKDELNNLKNFQSYLLKVQPENNTQLSMNSNYWFDVSTYPTEELNKTAFQVDGNYLLKIYTQNANTTLELNYINREESVFHPILFVLEGEPYAFLSNTKYLPIIWSGNLNDSGRVSVVLSGKGWYTISLFGQRIMGGSRPALLDASLGSCAIRGEIRVLNGGEPVPFGLATYRTVQSLYIQEN